MSVPYGDHIDMLYLKTCRLLEESKQVGADKQAYSSVPSKLVQTEYIQAWRLLVHYKFLRVNRW